MAKNRHTLSATAVGQFLRDTLWRCCVLSICASIVLAPGLTRYSHAETPIATGSQLDPLLLAKLSKRGDLTLRKTNLAEALFTISELWKINLVVGEEVEGQVNGVFQQAPLSEILDAILLSNGYSYRPVGQSLVVMKLNELGDVHTLFETAIVPVRKSDPKEIVESAGLLSSPKGRIKPIPSAKSIMVVDFPDRIAMIRKFVSRLEGTTDGAPAEVVADSLQVAYFTPQYISAATLKDALGTVMSNEGRLSILELENRVVMVDYPEQLKLAKQVVESVDFARPQVRITAYIYDVALEDLERLGVNWDALIIDGRGNDIFGLNTITNVPFADGALGGAITFANMSNHLDLTAVVNALATLDKSRLLADPNVTVMDNETATLSSVEEIPFQQLTQTGNGGNLATTGFREAGIKLRVKPRITREGTVVMAVEPEFSRLQGFEDGQPIIDRRSASTVVTVKNTETIVIGGLRTHADRSNNNSIPILRSIPLVGHLFEGKEKFVRESELLVFIRPEIVYPDEPLKPREAQSCGSLINYLDLIPPLAPPTGPCGEPLLNPFPQEMMFEDVEQKRILEQLPPGAVLEKSLPTAPIPRTARNTTPVGKTTRALPVPEPVASPSLPQSHDPPSSDSENRVPQHDSTPTESPLRLQLKAADSHSAERSSENAPGRSSQDSGYNQSKPQIRRLPAVPVSLVKHDSQNNRVDQEQPIRPLPPVTVQALHEETIFRRLPPIETPTRSASPVSERRSRSRAAAVPRLWIHNLFPLD